MTAGDCPSTMCAECVLILGDSPKLAAEVLRWTEYCAATNATVGKTEHQIRTMDECYGRSQQENPPSRDIQGTMKSGLAMDTNIWCLSFGLKHLHWRLSIGVTRRILGLGRWHFCFCFYLIQLLSYYWANSWGVFKKLWLLSAKQFW